MNESYRQSIRALLRVGRAVGLLLLGVVVGIMLTPYLAWGHPVAWDWKTMGWVFLGLVGLILSVVAERWGDRASRRSGSDRSVGDGS